MTTPARKTYSRRADIPPDVLARLNAGTLATATLAEGLALDFAVLLAAAVPDIPADGLEYVRASAAVGITRRMDRVGQLLVGHLGVDGLPRLAGHPSDTVRGWACYVVGLAPKLTPKDRLALIRPLAADPHFGVREWAWMPVRPHLAANLGQSVRLLTPWTKDKNPFVRRYAVEVLRPRGVWTCHIEALKENPEIGLPLLEPLRADGEKYVQDSVANWLNDAAKSQPDWVRDVCERWQRESPGAATERIVTRALRSIAGKGS